MVSLSADDALLQSELDGLNRARSEKYCGVLVPCDSTEPGSIPDELELQKSLGDDSRPFRVRRLAVTTGDVSLELDVLRLVVSTVGSIELDRLRSWFL